MKRVLKIMVGVTLLGLLAWGVDWTQADTLVRRMHAWVLALALAYMCFEMPFSAFKWSRALRMLGLRFPMGHLVRTVCTAYYFNNFLPSAVGGDAYRVYRTLPEEGYRSRAVAAILIDRVLGLLALLTLGAASAVLLLRETPVARGYLICYVVGVACGVLGLVAVHFGWCKPLTNRIRHTRAFQAVEHNVDRLKRVKVEWLAQFGLSLLFQAGSVMVVWWLFRHTATPMPFTKCALMTAAAGVAAVLPISPNGVGVVEGALVGMAEALGAGYEEAVMVSILRRLLMIAVSLLCGLVYLAEGRPRLVPAGKG